MSVECEGSRTGREVKAVEKREKPLGSKGLDQQFGWYFYTLREVIGKKILIPVAYSTASRLS